MVLTVVYLCYCFVLFFFFKQKTAYEMRISDWSSDVCSSDLPVDLIAGWTRHDAFPFALMTEGNALAARLKGAALTRRLFNRGAQSIVDGARSAGARAWLYRLDFSPTRALRAGHCIDLPLILGDEAAWGQMPLISGLPWPEEIGRASCRVRVCQYV